MNQLSTTFWMTLLLFVCFAGSGFAQNQPFYFGNDLSYVNQMEDCGADYKRGGVSQDPYKIFAEEGTNLVRVRLWVDPSWWQEPLNQPEGVKPWYSDLEDVKKTIQRAKAEGMEVMMGFHYSDFWADPGRQLIPRQWLDSAHNPEALADSVYHYTKQVLTELDAEGLMPEFVKVGNENNPGVMVHIPEENGYNPVETVASSNNWQRHAMIFNAGISAVREVGETASINPKIALHWSNLSGVQYWYNNMISNGVTDFDIIGFSYYYAWHDGSISQLKSTVESLVQNFPGYDVMAVETGYLWSNNYGGIINEADPEYLPVIPEKQLEYMVDYTRAVMQAGGNGVIFWEPAWVDTPCRTPWITGSSHTHVAFFDPVNTNFMENGGGKWMNPEFYEFPDAPKTTFLVDMSGQEVSEEGMYITGSFTGQNEWEIQPMADLGNGIYSYFTYLPEGSEGAFYFLNGNSWEDRETVPDACAEMFETDRAYTIPGNDSVIDYKWASCEPIYASGEVNVTFSVDMAGSGVDYSGSVYITGTFTAGEGGGNWEILPMTQESGEVYSYQTVMEIGDEGAYYFLSDNDWSARETVPSQCADWYNSDRGYAIPDEDIEIGFQWGTCQAIESGTNTDPETYSPNGFELAQNFPNPFNPVTQISYQIPDASMVSLVVYDMTGRKIKELVNTSQAAGNYQVTFDATDLSSGIYLYKLNAGGFTQTKKLTLIK